MRRTIAATACALALGCGGGEAPSAEPRAAAREVGFVQMEYTQGVLEARAVFARVGGLEPGTAARLLGLADDAWAEDLAPGDCRAIDLAEELDEALGRRMDGTLGVEAVGLELREVGRLEVRVGGERTAFRAEPLVLPFAAGVVYEAEPPWIPEEPYVVEVAGGEALALSVLPPPEARLRGHTAFAPGRDLEVRWDPGDPPDALVWAEVGWVRHGRNRVVRCLARDDGRAVVPAAALVDALGPAATPTVAVVRVRRAEVAAGWSVRFAGRDAAALRVAP